MVTRRSSSSRFLYCSVQPSPRSHASAERCAHPSSVPPQTVAPADHAQPGCVAHALESASCAQGVGAPEHWGPHVHPACATHVDWLVKLSHASGDPLQIDVNES